MDILEIIDTLGKRGILFSEIIEDEKLSYIWDKYKITFCDTYIDISGLVPYELASKIEQTMESRIGLIRVFGKKTTSNKVIDNVEYNGNTLEDLDRKMMAVYSPEKLFVSRYNIRSKDSFIMFVLLLNEYLNEQVKAKQKVITG